MTEPNRPGIGFMAASTDAKLRDQIAQTCLTMNKLGLNQGTAGNVSARNSSGFLITPSGIAYDRMNADQIVQMDLAAGYRGDWTPSSEWRMHLDIYSTRPEAMAVVHVHSTFATALSCLRKEIPPFHYMIGVAGGATLRCAEYRMFGTQALSDAMIAALEGRAGCLLANHGQICFGPDLEKALWLAGEIETLCQQFWIASQMGEPVLLGEGEMAAVLERFKTYGKQPSDLPAGSLAALDLPTRRAD